MKKLKITSLYNNLHFLFILLILVVLSLKYWYFIPVLLIYLIFLFKKTPLFFIGVILSIIVLISSSRYLFKHEKNEFSGLVIECDNKKATVLTEFNLVLVYHKEELNLGDYASFKVSNLDYSSDLFDYKEYLLSKDIKNYYKLEKFEFHNNYFVIRKINNFFTDQIREGESNNKEYINSLVFADKSNLDIKEEATNLGISHLLAVSGMHISVLVLII